MVTILRGCDTPRHPSLGSDCHTPLRSWRKAGTTSAPGNRGGVLDILNSSGETGSTSERGMYDSMRKKAAEAGANGIILGNIVEPTAGTKIVGALFGTGSQRKGTSTAIYIPSDSTRVQACNGVENRAATQP